MRLVFLYGPPAVGKLTVARELAALTGFRLFHNHLTVDLVSAVFSRGTPSFGRLIPQFRRVVFAEAAQEGVDLIFTYVYAHPDDSSDVQRMTEPVIASGGEVHYVQLMCAPATLIERVQDESRRAFGKLNDPEALHTLMERYDLLTPLPFAESLQLDVTIITPVSAAAQIASRYALPTLQPPVRFASGQQP